VRRGRKRRTVKVAVSALSCTALGPGPGSGRSEVQALGSEDRLDSDGDGKSGSFQVLGIAGVNWVLPCGSWFCALDA
jgi:hypothetical protein